MKLIIFSYPFHFRISQLCEHFARQHLPEISEVVYAWDDLAHPGHPGESILRSIGKKIVRYSSFNGTVNEPVGWLRQQYVKLQLHHAFDDDAWIIIDGDAILRQTFITRSSGTLTWFGCHEHYIPYFNFIDDCLGLKKRNNFSFISPLNAFEREVLVQLEQFSLERNGIGVVDFYLSNKKHVDVNIVPPFSEFEIYGTFATQVMGRDYEPVLNHFSEGQDFSHVLLNTSRSVVLQGSDDQVAEEAWKKYRPLVLTAA